MGNTQPTNKTGRKVVAQKLENAKKTGVLSLSEHKLEHYPDQIFELSNLKTLDLSRNSLSHLNPKIVNMKMLKSLNLEHNKLPAGSLTAISKLSKLQTLSLGGNRLGKPAAAPKGSPNKTTADNTSAVMALPSPLPTSLKQIKLNANFMSSIPPSLTSPSLTKLEKLNLSQNQLAAVSDEISNLTNLTELLLDDNGLTRLPKTIGQLSKLKVLSLKNNRISVSSTKWTDDYEHHTDGSNPQALPKSLFCDTPLIDLNLHGNPMTSTQLNEMVGYHQFLERRQKVKTRTLLGGGLTNLDVCGLE